MHINLQHVGEKTVINKSNFMWQVLYNKNCDTTECHECAIYKAPKQLVSYIVMMEIQTQVTNLQYEKLKYQKVQRKQVYLPVVVLQQLSLL